MKSAIALIVSWLMMFSACGCQATEGDVENKGQLERPSTPSSNILVVYFSATGATKTLAESAADYLNADLYEIVPEIPYTDEDLAYYTDCRADREQKDPDARPEIAGMVEDMNQYGTILLGYPIWHGQAPRIISTFLESYDFSGKTIAPFCTSHSSGIGSSDTDLYALCGKDTKWIKGKRFGRDGAGEELKDWLNEIGITQTER
ncbi:MAG: flavodoxin [Firmicutes bacterium]|nr:flavodoxin [Bacillota bacterium]